MLELNYIETPPMLEQIVARTGSLGFNMASELLTGVLLRTLAASKPKGRFLELGTGTGIATAWLLAGMDADSTLTTVDTDVQVQNVARELLGHDRRLRKCGEMGTGNGEMGTSMIGKVKGKRRFPSTIFAE